MPAAGLSTECEPCEVPGPQLRCVPKCRRSPCCRCHKRGSSTRRPNKCGNLFRESPAREEQFLLALRYGRFRCFLRPLCRGIECRILRRNVSGLDAGLGCPRVLPPKSQGVRKPESGGREMCESSRGF